MEEKIHSLWSEVKIVWVIPHPIDMETFVKFHQYQSINNTTMGIHPNIIFKARSLTKMMNGVFQAWEGVLRKDIDRLVFPWFLIFIKITNEGSKLFVNFMKQVRTVSPKQEIMPLLPEAMEYILPGSH